MLVFRDGRRQVSGRALKEGLASHLRPLACASADPELLLDALLRAGELECALADAGVLGRQAAAGITGDLAAAFVSGSPAPVPRLLESLGAIAVPESLQVSTPEGFAYYALHPLAYAELACDLELRADSVAVIGIRSIGTTLSAVVRAALAQRGLHADRITVRPEGHPFDRRTEFDQAQRQWLAGHQGRGSEFLVVDEGPGLSGSSFLSVGEALARHLVPRERITFLTAHNPYVERFKAHNAAQRWAAFRHVAVPGWHEPPQPDALFVGNGEWRRHFCPDNSCWPACWTSMEAPKYLSPEGRLFKFEGYGRFGEARYQRALALADAGFSPPPLGRRNGFVEYPIVGSRGVPVLSASVLNRLAEYCAFRRAAFPADRPADLAFMTRLNFQEEFGAEPGLDDALLQTQFPVICDARMAPGEWLDVGGELLKIDAISHGDDHFYPGPADIAWDLAGAIVEWQMDRATSDYFLDQYRHAAGDDPRPRLPAYMLAYLAFRFAHGRMAAEAMGGTAEEPRLRADYQRYRALAESRLASEAAIRS